MNTRFFVYLFDWTKLAGEAIDVVFAIRGEPWSAEDLRNRLGSDQGSFKTLEAAREFIREAGGKAGVQKQRDLLDEDDGVIERWSLGAFGLLTPNGTRIEYAEWAYDAAEDISDEDIARLVEEQVRLARQLENARPDPDTLADLLREYRENRDNE